MFITITSSIVTLEQSQEVGDFLSKFLPKMQQQAGVLAAYHYDRPDKGDDVTVIVWPSQEAVQAYKQGDLVKEAQAFEKAHGLSTTREGYPLSYPTTSS